ncbi:MAG: T9SS type A sorting domain-containing protein [Ignavibacteriae bacterium]|nr:T9SS type A sorting domain-containing protein [Ignavibacteriota bacterium]
MKKFFILLAVFSMMVLSNVSFGQWSDTLQGNINGTVTLSEHRSYLMLGEIVVQNGATLVIPAGTYLYGDAPTKASIIVLRGGKIYAKGTASDPIVFTSRNPVGSRAAGDWGGIVILGNATINTNSGVDTAAIEGFSTNYYYGGNNDDDSSGCLSYCRIEFAGIALAPNNEINSLTMGGVGRKTQIDHIMVSFAGDDAVECFGGTVNVKYFVAAFGVDDMFDTDNGYRGRFQFGLGISDPNIADVSGSNGFESDNNSAPNYNNPRTWPFYSNMTLVGPKEYDTTTVDPNFKRGAHIRRNVKTSIWNTVWMGWPTGTLFDGTGVFNACTGDTLKYKSNIIAGCLKNIDTAGTTTTPFNANAFVFGAGQMTDTFATTQEVMLNSPYSGLNNHNYSINDFMPQGGSPVFSNFIDANTIDPFFTSTNYRGAFGSGSNWLDGGWVNFRPDTVDYSVGINQVSSNVPERYTLSQNYPNPFNPSTVINFSLPVKGFVTLKVYDVLGQEVATLVNNVLTVGEYAYEFDASKLSSGIYFYTLKGENFVETKKMMLVK